jgi:hypothetical protein
MGDTQAVQTATSFLITFTATSRCNDRSRLAIIARKFIHFEMFQASKFPQEVSKHSSLHSIGTSFKSLPDTEHPYWRLSQFSSDPQRKYPNSKSSWTITAPFTSFRTGYSKFIIWCYIMEVSGCIYKLHIKIQTYFFLFGLFSISFEGSLGWEYHQNLGTRNFLTKKLKRTISCLWAVARKIVYISLFLTSKSEATNYQISFIFFQQCIWREEINSWNIFLPKFTS